MTSSADRQGPGIPLPRSSGSRSKAIYQLLAHMESRQWWSAARLRRQQFRDAAVLLRYAREYSPFYAERLKSLDLDYVDEELFRSIPLLTRQELQSQRDHLACRQIPEQHGSRLHYTTSGSTGTPVTVDGTMLTSVIWSAVTMRDHLWHRRDHRLTNAAVRWQADDSAMAPAGRELPDWGPPFSEFYATGPALLLNSASPLHAQLAWLRRHNPHYLITHPSNLLGLLQEIADAPAELTQLREIRTVGESLGETTRQRVRDILDVPVVDFYSCQEAGYIALQCPDHPHYHLQAEQLLVEVLDDHGKPCAPGQQGRVVITSLSNYAMPLIRYVIGDYAEVGAPCPCGRGLPVLNRILGRVRNLLTLPDGSRRWPNFGMRDMLRIIPAKQFQVVQHEPARLELRLVVDSLPGAEQEQQVKANLARHLQFAGSIDISYHEQLQRSASGKFEDFVSRIPGPESPAITRTD